MKSFEVVSLPLLLVGGHQPGGGNDRADTEIINSGSQGGEDSASGSGD